MSWKYYTSFIFWNIMYNIAVSISLTILFNWLHKWNHLYVLCPLWEWHTHTHTHTHTHSRHIPCFQYHWENWSRHNRTFSLPHILYSNILLYSHTWHSLWLPYLNYSRFYLTLATILKLFTFLPNPNTILLRNIFSICYFTSLPTKYLIYLILQVWSDK